jgi:hypothetical protein
MHANLIGIYGRELASQRERELASAARHRHVLNCLKQVRRDERAALISGTGRTPSGCPVDLG